MKRLSMFVALLPLVTLPAGWGRAQGASDKSVVTLDPALDALISPDAKVELVKTGFGFTEGTNWVQKGKTGYLLFTDIPANVINKMTPDGTVTVFAEHVGYSGPITGFEMVTVGGLSDNGKDPKDPRYRRFVMVGADGLTLDNEGRVIVCTFAGRSVVRIEKNGKRTVLADHYEGKRLDGPNDAVVKKDGAIYFSDTLSGLRYREKDPTREMDSDDYYMIKDGKLTRVISDIKIPNGLAFSPDEKILYANGGRDNYIRRYDVQPDDTLANSRLLIDLSVDKTPGATDGMRVDSRGNIYTSGPGGIWIVSPEGKHLGTILTPERVANLTFGDPDFRTLYIAARTSIYKIRVLTPGQPCNSCTSK